MRNIVCHSEIGQRRKCTPNQGNIIIDFQFLPDKSMHFLNYKVKCKKT